MKSQHMWKLLLYLVPFFNILNYRINGNISLLIIVLFIMIYMIIAKNRTILLRDEMNLLIFSVICLVIVLIDYAFSFIFNIGNWASIRFFSLFVFIIPVFLVKGEPLSFIKNNLLHYIKYLIVIISSSIIIDYLFLLIGMPNLQPMYDVENYSYLDRPFGIFGQPSVNSCILCFCYLFYRALQERLCNEDKSKCLLFLVILGVLIQGSGSGYISLLLLLFSILIRKNSMHIRWGNIFLIIVIFAPIVYYVIVSNVIEKISMDYIHFLMQFFYDDLITPYLKIANSCDKILFGIPDFPLSIDFGPLYILGTVGLFFLMFIVFFTLYLFFKANNFNMKMAIIILLIGNLHYPVMFYLIMHFLWFFILYYVFVVDKCHKIKYVDSI